MSLVLNPILDRFAERTPIPVMARSVLERCLNARQLDAWFETVAEEQYTRGLLFSTVFALMTAVVFRQQPSVNAAYQARSDDIGVSVTSVYNKLNGLEPTVTAGLVGFASERAEALIEQLGGAKPGPLPGWRVKVLDGNGLGGREHRLKELRTLGGAPPPGKSVAVFDPALEVFTALFPREDADTQERALWSAVVHTVRAGELWLADRNFRARAFIEQVVERKAAVLIREHEGLRWTPLEPIRACGRTTRGQVTEQRVRLGAAEESGGLALRRVCLQLDEPTRDGETTVSLLTDLPEAAASAATVAELYLTRWTIETAFLRLTVELRCEIDTLGYPRAALFGFAVAAVAFKVLAVVKAALRQVHGVERIEQSVSSFYLSTEMANLAEALDTLLDPEAGRVFQTLSTAVIAAWLLELAGRVNLRKYRNHPRGPKKASPKRKYDPRHLHVSVARILNERKAQRETKSP
ncbi:MAG TPA: transposase [Candidatus Competibacter sp.]|nr:transposase [Candidatus Competibacter sp.]HRW64468.1 transposase [Candidatus Competibacter sp.]